jgi:hypothetical protein
MRYRAAMAIAVIAALVGTANAVTVNLSCRHSELNLVTQIIIDPDAPMIQIESRIMGEALRMWFERKPPEITLAVVGSFDRIAAAGTNAGQSFTINYDTRLGVLLHTIIDASLPGLVNKYECVGR